MRALMTCNASMRVSSVARNTRGYCVGQSRREFIKSTTAAAAMAGIAAQPSTGRVRDRRSRPLRSRRIHRSSPPSPTSKSSRRSLSTPRRAPGPTTPTFASSAIATRTCPTREQRVSGVSDNETYGFGVRTLVGGCVGLRRESRSDEGRSRRASRSRPSHRRAPIARRSFVR